MPSRPNMLHGLHLPRSSPRPRASCLSGGMAPDRGGSRGCDRHQAPRRCAWRLWRPCPCPIGQPGIASPGLLELPALPSAQQRERSLGRWGETPRCPCILGHARPRCRSQTRPNVPMAPRWRRRRASMPPPSKQTPSPILPKAAASPCPRATPAPAVGSQALRARKERMPENCCTTVPSSYEASPSSPQGEPKPTPRCPR
mmetsp:Transcript_60378/g.156813  ORF Transcript_60378/g.156813 Transcript_60378/m.156813 type:complete len:200 (+) Transcript_60378:707-1306(+)